jgi:penicillin-binding protein 1A
LVAAVEKGIGLDTVWRGPSSIVIPDERCLGPDPDHPGEDKPWEVGNYSDGEAGTFTLAQAIAHSVNTVFAQLVVDVGPDQVVRVMRDLGVRQSKLEDVCSITLGSQAITPMEMTSSYATLAARGVYHAPVAINEIRTASGDVVEKASLAGERVMKQNDADVVTYALEGVVQGGTGTAAQIGRPVAGKTGTGQNHQDAWFCGYTPQLAACVWVGYRKGEIPMHDIHGFSNVFGGSIPAMIWHEFMAKAMEAQPVMDFATPDLSGYDTIPEHAGVFVSDQPTTGSHHKNRTGGGPAPQPSPEPSPTCYRPKCKPH